MGPCGTRSIDASGSTVTKRASSWLSARCVTSRIGPRAPGGSAGTSVRESVALIRHHGAQPCAVAIALDRMERGSAALSATEEVVRSFGIPVVAIANLDDLVAFVAAEPGLARHLDAVRAYRDRYRDMATSLGFEGHMKWAEAMP